MLINFLTSFQGLRPYSGLHRAYSCSISIRYKWGYAYSFCQIFQKLRLFKGLRLFQTLEYYFLPTYSYNFYQKQWTSITYKIELSKMKKKVEKTFLSPPKNIGDQKIQSHFLAKIEAFKGQ